MAEPRFHGTASDKSHRNMSRIKGKDTSIELGLRRALWHQGIRFRKNYRAIPGSPDIALTKYKIAIFCDSEFFHGKDWEEKRTKVASGTNGDYWVQKIERNIHRDAEKDRALENLGWKVLRFWGKDIIHDIDACVQTVQDTIFAVQVEAWQSDDKADYINTDEMDLRI